MVFVIDNIIKLFFSVDVVLGFRKAYMGEDGQIVKDPVMIAKNYLQFYFWVDLLSAIPFDNFVDSGLLRYISLIKIFRLYRFQQVIYSIGFGQNTRAKIRIIQIIVTMMIIIHWTTCYFYQITDSEFSNSEYEKVEEFYYSHWIPPVDINDHYTEFYY